MYIILIFKVQCDECEEKILGQMAFQKHKEFCHFIFPILKSFILYAQIFFKALNRDLVGVCYGLIWYFNGTSVQYTTSLWLNVNFGLICLYYPMSLFLFF